MSDLFAPLRAGALDLANRVVLAPLTRNRAQREGDLPGPLAAEYYTQRASAGLLITEGTQVSPQGKGYLDTPGIYSAAQVEGWRQVTDAVHAAGGRIIPQLWHVGRVSHVDLQQNGQPPVAPSAIAARTKTFLASGFANVSEPRALALDEIAGVVADFEQGARNAKAAGFDGAEIHCAHGYLVDQFMRDGANQRTDRYGGSIENRTRFLAEVVEAVTGVLGADRVGVRLSPLATVNGITDSDPHALFTHAIDLLSGFGLAYLHLVEGQTGGQPATREEMEPFRSRWKGVYMANNGYDGAKAKAALEDGWADLVAFGRSFIANPDLVARLQRGAALNVPDQATFYGGDARGYTDYPTLAQAA